MAGTAGSCSPVPTPSEWREKLCCRCPFKGASCGYRGSENWCDHTRARCDELGNLDRFDGTQPDLVEPEELHPVDAVAAILCLACYAFALPWSIAVPIYAISCMIFIPGTRGQAIVFWELHVQPLRRHFMKPMDTEQGTEDKD